MPRGMSNLCRSRSCPSASSGVSPTMARMSRRTKDIASVTRMIFMSAPTDLSRKARANPRHPLRAFGHRIDLHIGRRVRCFRGPVQRIRSCCVLRGRLFCPDGGRRETNPPPPPMSPTRWPSRCVLRAASGSTTPTSSCRHRRRAPRRAPRALRFCHHEQLLALRQAAPSDAGPRVTADGPRPRNSTSPKPIVNFTTEASLESRALVPRPSSRNAGWWRNLDAALSTASWPRPTFRLSRFTGPCRAARRRSSLLGRPGSRAGRAEFQRFGVVGLQ